MSEPSIKTTVVGSYPLPAWLAAYPSVPNLRDAILVVLKTQELAGLDVISDGELTRFDVNHPETNGMIEYFVRPMGGISSRMGRKDVADFRAQQGMGFRAQPAGVVEGPISEGEMDLPSSWQLVKGLTATPLKFTVTAPYMLAKTLLDRHYRDLPSLTMAIAEVLRRQVEAIDAPVLQVDEANLTGHPEDAAWATSRSTMCWMARAANARCISASATTAGRASRAASGPICSASSTTCTWTIWCWSLPAAATMNWRFSAICARASLWGSKARTRCVIDIKDNEVESADEVARRIQHAVDLLGAQRVKWIHPDCGFWMLPRSVADRKMQTLVAGRDLFLGRSSG